MKPQISDSRATKTMNENEWVSCKWSLKQLHRKRVEFATNPKNTSTAGVGEFLVLQRSDQKMKIQISVDVAGPGQNERTDHRWTLDQRQADAIRENPDLGIAAFQMFSDRF